MDRTDRFKRIKLNVFGCQMNKLDAELVKSVLDEGGYTFTEAEEEAGVILFLTCSVREHAEHRVHSRIGALKTWKRKFPRSTIGVLGCMAQKDGKALLDQHPNLDLVVGTRDFPRIVELLQRVERGERNLVALGEKSPPRVIRNRAFRPQRCKAFLSVMRGCDRYCSYCVVPFVRGRETSRPLEEILEEGKRLVSDGVKEITLLGQTVNAYDGGDGRRLSDLLRVLDALPGLQRLKFITSHPAYVDRDLARAMAECRTVTRSLHLPAQSGSDSILRKMNRRYTVEEYMEAVSLLREAMPDLEIASDFIVGFPGEVDEDFEATEALMEEVRFQQVFVFKYSPRPGTAAAKRYPDDVPGPVKADRNARLLALQERICREKNAAWEGRVVEVLVEGLSRRDSERYTGRSFHNHIVAFPGAPDLVGELVQVRIEDSTALTLLGRCVEEGRP